MYVARVVGTVVTPVQHPFFDGRTLLLVHRVELEGGPAGRADGKAHDRVAVDTIGAGVGDVVLVLEEGNSARQIVDDGKAPVRNVVIGFVDEVELQGKIVLSNDDRHTRRSPPPAERIP